MCLHCALDPNNVSIQVIGANQKNEFTQVGFKLSSYDQSKHKFAIPVVIGCGPDSLRALIGYKENNQVLFGNRIYNRLQTRFCGKKLIINDEMIRRLRKEESPAITNGNGQHSHKQIAESLLARASDNVPDMEVDNFNMTPTEEVADSSPRTESPNSLVHYAHFFDDPEKLHLAVVALVSRYKPDEPFGFNEFIQVLAEDVGLPVTSNLKIMMSKAYVFLSRDFIMRLNPGQKPSKYCLTKHAFDYAEDKTIVSLPVSKQRKEPKKIHEKPLPLLSGVAKIKELESRFQALQNDLARAEQKVAGLKESELDSEEKDLDGQRHNLEERLLAISNRKKEIVDERQNISEAKDEVQSIKRKLEAKDLVKGHEEFENLKKLFLS